jgi:O-antigen/teichoic acid export membrane protein
MKKIVAKNFIIYALPSVVSRFVPFITLPITTNYLNLPEFGYIAIFELCLLPFQVIISFGPGYVINSNWFQINEEQRKKLIFSLLVLSVFLCLLGIIVIGSLSNLIFPLFSGSDWHRIQSLLPYLYIYAFALIPGTIFTSWVVIEQKAILSTLVKSLHIIMSASAIIIAAKFTQDYEYIIIANVLVNLFIALIQFVFLLLSSRVSFEKDIFVNIYKVCSPIYIRSFFNIFRTQFDKVIVSGLYGASQFALYHFSGKINNLVNEAGEHYQNAYDPFIYKGLSEKNLEVKNLRLIFFSWSYFIITVMSIFIIWGELLIDVITNGVFTGSYSLVILYTCVIVVSLPFMGNGQVIIFYKKTKYLLYITIIQAALIGISSVILIPKYGPPAGIFSFWLGTIIYMLLYFYKKRQLHKEYFIENIIWFYVVLHHIIVILIYFNITKYTLLLLSISNIVMFLHFIIINKLLLKKIFLKLRVKLISVHAK